MYSCFLALRLEQTVITILATHMIVNRAAATNTATRALQMTLGRLKQDAYQSTTTEPTVKCTQAKGKGN